MYRYCYISWQCRNCVFFLCSNLLFDSSFNYRYHHLLNYYVQRPKGQFCVYIPSCETKHGRVLIEFGQLIDSSIQNDTSTSLSQNAYKLLTRRSIKFYQKKYEISTILPEIDPVLKLGLIFKRFDDLCSYKVVNNRTNLPSKNEIQSTHVFNLQFE